MASAGLCKCAAPPKACLQSHRSSVRSNTSTVRFSQQHRIKAQSLRPLKRRSVTTRCESQNGATRAPEASVTCLGEALFGKLPDCKACWVRHTPSHSESHCRLLGRRAGCAQRASQDLDSIPGWCTSQCCSSPWPPRCQCQLCQCGWTG